MRSINLPTATPAEKIVKADAIAPIISIAIVIAEALLCMDSHVGFLCNQRVTGPL